MAKRKNEAGEFPGLLALMRRGIDFGNLFVDTAASLCDETQNDRICGSWDRPRGQPRSVDPQAGDGLYGPAVRHIALLQADRAGAIRRLPARPSDRARRRRFSGQRTVLLRFPHRLLRAGTLGLFEAEDEVLRRAACETDFNRFPYDEI